MKQFSIWALHNISFWLTLLFCPLTLSLSPLPSVFDHPNTPHFHFTLLSSMNIVEGGPEIKAHKYKHLSFDVGVKNMYWKTVYSTNGVIKIASLPAEEWNQTQISYLQQKINSSWVIYFNLKSETLKLLKEETLRM